jgi:hypothetical protein
VGDKAYIVDAGEFMKWYDGKVIPLKVVFNWGF